MKPVSQLSFDAETKIARMTLKGPQSAATLMAALATAASSSEYQAATRRLWDIRDADVGALNLGALTGAREYLVAAKGRPARVAVVATTDLQFGVGRQFEVLSEGSLPVSVQVFHTVEEAEAWLGALPPTE